MLIIPAIDIKEGKCVRLHQGQMDKATIYSEDPLAMAERWLQASARRLHVIDLDGAVQGKPVNIEIIRSICSICGDIPIQVGGGIRDEQTIESYLEAGVGDVIIGTQAVNKENFVADICKIFPGHITVGLDAKQGKVAIDGWSKLSNHDVHDVAKRLQNMGITAIIFTDINRDGMLSRVNVKATVALAKEVKIPIIASGGLHNLEDVRALCAVADVGISGVITGRAIYEGTLDLAMAQSLADELSDLKGT